MADLEKLIEMGFPKEKAEYALKLNKDSGADAAIDWLINYGDALDLNYVKPMITVDTETIKRKNLSRQSIPATEKVKSRKCETCGLSIIQQTHLKARRRLSKNQTDFDDNMMLIGKQKPLHSKEMTNKLEVQPVERKCNHSLRKTRKRRENTIKIILEDRTEEDTEFKKAAREYIQSQSDSKRTIHHNMSHKDEFCGLVTLNPRRVLMYSKTQILIRLLDGSKIIETFQCTEKLTAVYLFIVMKTGIKTEFDLLVTYPHKIFQRGDYNETLQTLNLIPTAVVIMTQPYTI